jgi:hypothetical protein
MKTAYRILLACATATSLMGITTSAKADTAAGSAAFSINNNGVVTGVSMSAAVSETGDTLAVGMNTQIGNATYALGSTTTITAPEWVRPADGDGQVQAEGEVVTGSTEIVIYDGEPEFWTETNPENNEEALEEALMEAYDKGYGEGYGEGSSESYVLGYGVGYSEGYDEGFNSWD